MITAPEEIHLLNLNRKSGESNAVKISEINLTLVITERIDYFEKIVSFYFGVYSFGKHGWSHYVYCLCF
jgi:hypothetical protein